MSKLGFAFLLFILSASSKAQEVKRGNYIYGKVVTDATGVDEPMVGARVVVSGYKLGCLTGIDGLYKINIPDSLFDKRVRVECGYVGYETYRKKVLLKKMPGRIDIVLHDGNKQYDSSKF
ncbi:MAG: carboxypeptidase-like regulatory domain-containing protein [Bacteroidetes bacterium]|nr:carboxypeptidase-like regulatory domain-containing protein [Bacteroidota bacterium]